MDSTFDFFQEEAIRINNNSVILSEAHQFILNESIVDVVLNTIRSIIEKIKEAIRKLIRLIQEKIISNTALNKKLNALENSNKDATIENYCFVSNDNRSQAIGTGIYTAEKIFDNMVQKIIKGEYKDESAFSYDSNNYFLESDSDLNDDSTIKDLINNLKKRIKQIYFENGIKSYNARDFDIKKAHSQLEELQSKGIGYIKRAEKMIINFYNNSKREINNSNTINANDKDAKDKVIYVLNYSNRFMHIALQQYANCLFEEYRMIKNAYNVLAG